MSEHESDNQSQEDDYEYPENPGPPPPVVEPVRGTPLRGPVTPLWTAPSTEFVVPVNFPVRKAVAAPEVAAPAPRTPPEADEASEEYSSYSESEAPVKTVQVSRPEKDTSEPLGRGARRIKVPKRFASPPLSGDELNSGKKGKWHPRQSIPDNPVANDNWVAKLSPDQHNSLLEQFALTPRPSMLDVVTLSLKLGIDRSKVADWFIIQRTAPMEVKRPTVQTPPKLNAHPVPGGGPADFVVPVRLSPRILLPKPAGHVDASDQPVTGGSTRIANQVAERRGPTTYMPYGAVRRQYRTPEQLAALEAQAESTPKPSTEIINAMSMQLGITYQQVEKWFKSRRSNEIMERTRIKKQHMAKLEVTRARQLVLAQMGVQMLGAAAVQQLSEQAMRHLVNTALHQPDPALAAAGVSSQPLDVYVPESYAFRDPNVAHANEPAKSPSSRPATAATAAATPGPDPRASCPFKMQDRVRAVNYNVDGTVRYVGFLGANRRSVWIGVELDEPVGTGDGTNGGKQYFKTEPKRGIFQLALDLEPLGKPTSTTSRTPPTSPAAATRAAPGSPSARTPASPTARSPAVRSVAPSSTPPVATSTAPEAAPVPEVKTSTAHAVSPTTKETTTATPMEGVVSRTALVASPPLPPAAQPSSGARLPSPPTKSPATSAPAPTPMDLSSNEQPLDQRSPALPARAMPPPPSSPAAPMQQIPTVASAVGPILASAVKAAGVAQPMEISRATTFPFPVRAFPTTAASVASPSVPLVATTTRAPPPQRPPPPRPPQSAQSLAEAAVQAVGLAVAQQIGTVELQKLGNQVLIRSDDRTAPLLAHTFLAGSSSRIGNAIIRSMSSMSDQDVASWPRARFDQLATRISEALKQLFPAMWFEEGPPPPKRSAKAAATAAEKGRAGAEMTFHEDLAQSLAARALKIIQAARPVTRPTAAPRRPVSLSVKGSTSPIVPATAGNAPPVPFAAVLNFPVEIPQWLLPLPSSRRPALHAHKNWRVKQKEEQAQRQRLWNEAQKKAKRVASMLAGDSGPPKSPPKPRGKPSILRKAVIKASGTVVSGIAARAAALRESHASPSVDLPAMTIVAAKGSLEGMKPSRYALPVPINRQRAAAAGIPINRQRAMAAGIPINRQRAAAAGIPINRQRAAAAGIPINRQRSAPPGIPINRQRAAAAGQLTARPAYPPQKRGSKTPPQRRGTKRARSPPPRPKATFRTPGKSGTPKRKVASPPPEDVHDVDGEMIIDSSHPRELPTVELGDDEDDNENGDASHDGDNKGEEEAPAEEDDEVVERPSKRARVPKKREDHDDMFVYQPIQRFRRSRY